MGFRLKLREPLTGGLKRVFCEQIDSALHLCQHPAKQRGVTVHEVRKHLKKLRAAMRLAAGKVGKNSKKQLFPCTEELLLLERESFSAAFAGWQRQAIPQLERIKARLMDWPLDGLNWKQICNAVCKIYRRGQRALAKTIDDPDAENFHAWRKRVKDAWYQLRILHPLNRTVLEEMAHDAEILGELLGSEHDLDFLLARLEKERGDSAFADELSQLQQTIAPRCAGTRTAFLRRAI